MKIPNSNIENFIHNKIQDVNAVLFYGQDQGLITERQDTIIKNTLGSSYDPLMHIRLDATELTKNPDKLYQEINNISLIPGARVFSICNVTNNFYKVIKDCLESSKSEDIIILIAGELPPSSSIRKYFENTGNIVSIPCYIDDHQTIYNIVRTELSDLKPDNETIQYIASNISGNRLIIKQELNKIKTYYLTKENINIEEIKSLVTESHINDFQEFANKVADKDTRKAINLLEDLISCGFPGVTIIRVLINYLYRILEVKSLMQNNNFNDAIKSLKPPVFFKQKDILRKHTNLWQISELELIIKKLSELETTCKTYSFIETNILIKFFVLIISCKTYRS